MLGYDMRHGYRGPANVLWKVGETPREMKRIIDSLKRQFGYGPLLPAVIISADAQEAVVLLTDGDSVSLTMDSVHWARRFISDMQQGAAPRKVNDVLQAGQQIWVRKVADGWWLSQAPDVNSALVFINPRNGVIIVLVGGFNFNQSKLNCATRALRQVDSNIKPFLCTTTMSEDLTLASMFNDVPISRWDAGAGSDWQPRNSLPQYAGLIHLCQGLGQSRNVVMVYAMHAMGVNHVAKYLQCLGFPAQNTVHAGSLALGPASFTPLQAARGYSVMTSGGFLVNPFFISKIKDGQGDVLFEERPETVCPQCDLPVIYGDTPKSNVLEDRDVRDVAISTEPQSGSVPSQPQLEQANRSLVARSGTQEYTSHMINTPLSFLIKSALNSNIFGEPGRMRAGWRAKHDLQQHDIGRETGTTNSLKSTWFSDYGPGVVASMRIGFDDHRRDLGHTTASEAIKGRIPGYRGGAKSAQSAWDSFMKSVLEGVPEKPLIPPPGTVTANTDHSTSQLANGGNSHAEHFIEGTQPTQQAVHEADAALTDGGGETCELS